MQRLAQCSCGALKVTATGEPSAVGAFADPAFPAPVRSVWEQSKHPWVRIETAQQHFLQGRKG